MQFLLKTVESYYKSFVRDRKQKCESANLLSVHDGEENIFFVSVVLSDYDRRVHNFIKYAVFLVLNIEWISLCW